MTAMHTTTIRDRYGRTFSEITVCGTSVVVERMLTVEGDPHPGRIVRGGVVLNGWRSHESRHESDEAAESAAETLAATERTLAAKL